MYGESPCLFIYLCRYTFVYYYVFISPEIEGQPLGRNDIILYALKKNDELKNRKRTARD